jgi:hypothetical protein
VETTTMTYSTTPETTTPSVTMMTTEVTTVNPCDAWCDEHADLFD